MYSTFLLASPLFKTEKLMKQKKVKARMTPSKSWTAHRRKTDEKSFKHLCAHCVCLLSTSVFLENHLYIRHAEGCFD
ncbi:hypothetical protein T4D_10952 [Trichinella pseudospiralis]|uniref:Uncharacterized protein n=1 Tax=Trichinella pseudospiralis TaxID=6337 RepID=A0A0V1FAA0_TRIPS|nr:hypothetical protein T4D_10952 [Trichinella pseudospiralis]